MLDLFSQAVGTYLSYWNAGGTFTNMQQIQEYLEARMMVWAESKVK